MTLMPSIHLPQGFVALSALFLAVHTASAQSLLSPLDTQTLATLTRPVITIQPVGTNIAPNSLATLCVEASGSPPLRYQWRRTGVNIPGATDFCFSIPQITPFDAGAYSVVVANDADAITSDPALLSVEIPLKTAGNDFADRVELLLATGLTGGTNTKATKESGEPDHAGKPGGSSVWYQWIPPNPGIATFRTIGSTFDTLLAVYTGTTLSNLTRVASDEDSGRFLSSFVQFNAIEGQAYQIAIDGFGAAQGSYLLDWSLEETTEVVPEILTQPAGATLLPGADYTLSVLAAQTNLLYQWFLNIQPVPGATNASLPLQKLTASDAGIYRVQISAGPHSIFSQPAILQLNLTGQQLQAVKTEDKFLDVLSDNNPLRLGQADGGGGGPPSPAPHPTPAGALSRGYSGTQTLNTAGSTTEPGEPNHCHVVGGASQWFTYLAEEPGELFLNTDGSDFDTVLAVYTGSGADFASLVEVACDNDSGRDGQDSSLHFPTKTNQLYFIAVDGVNGQTGLLLLNYSLVIPAQLSALRPNPDGLITLRLSGRPEMRFSLEASSNSFSWIPLLDTNAPSGSFDYTDLQSTNLPNRLYRALMLP